MCVCVFLPLLLAECRGVDLLLLVEAAVTVEGGLLVLLSVVGLLVALLSPEVRVPPPEREVLSPQNPPPMAPNISLAKDESPPPDPAVGVAVGVAPAPPSEDPPARNEPRVESERRESPRRERAAESPPAAVDPLGCPDCRFGCPDSRLPCPDCQFCCPDCRLGCPDCRLACPDCRLGCPEVELPAVCPGEFLGGVLLVEERCPEVWSCPGVSDKENKESRLESREWAESRLERVEWAESRVERAESLPTEDWLDVVYSAFRYKYFSPCVLCVSVCV